MTLLSTTEVLRLTGVPRATWYRWLNDKERDMPQPVKLGRFVAYRYDSIYHWARDVLGKEVSSL